MALLQLDMPWFLDIYGRSTHFFLIEINKEWIGEKEGRRKVERRDWEERKEEKLQSGYEIKF